MLEVFQSRGDPAAFTIAPGTVATIARSSAVIRVRHGAEGAHCASQARAAWAATPKPTMPATFSVPARRPSSWGPPGRIDSIAAPGRMAIAPTPFGPWSLWALQVSASMPSVVHSTGSRPTHCTASVCRTMSAARHRAATSAIGWITPVSLFAHIRLSTLMPRPCARSSSSSASRSITPSGRWRSQWTAVPRASRDCASSRTALCSSALVASAGRPGRAAIAPRITRCAASVPPEVKVTARVVQPSRLATCSRASSMAWRASTPARWTLLGFAHRSRMQDAIASTTSGSGWVVALQSRYACMVQVAVERSARRSASVLASCLVQVDVPSRPLIASMARDLPSSTPHWSKELMPHTTPCTKVECS